MLPIGSTAMGILPPNLIHFNFGRAAQIRRVGGAFLGVAVGAAGPDVGDYGLQFGVGGALAEGVAEGGAAGGEQAGE